MGAKIRGVATGIVLGGLGTLATFLRVSDIDEIPDKFGVDGEFSHSVAIAVVAAVPTGMLGLLGLLAGIALANRQSHLVKGVGIFLSGLMTALPTFVTSVLASDESLRSDKTQLISGLASGGALLLTGLLLLCYFYRQGSSAAEEEQKLLGEGDYYYTSADENRRKKLTHSDALERVPGLPLFNEEGEQLVIGVNDPRSALTKSDEDSDVAVVVDDAGYQPPSPNASPRIS